MITVYMLLFAACFGVLCAACFAMIFRLFKSGLIRTALMLAVWFYFLAPYFKETVEAVDLCRLSPANVEQQAALR